MDSLLLQYARNAEDIYNIKDHRKELNKFIEWAKALPYYNQAVSIVATERHLSEDIVLKSDMVFLNDDIRIEDIPKEFHPDNFGLCKWKNVKFRGRVLYPIKDTDGDVMGFCAWDKFAKPKYIDSETYGFPAKKGTLYGLELIRQYYESNEKLYVFESITDSLILRDHGMQAVATLGSLFSRYIRVILRRFGTRLVIVGDSDNWTGEEEEGTAGEKSIKLAKYYFPESIRVQTKNNKDLGDVVGLGEDYKERVISELKSISPLSFNMKELRLR